MTRIYVVTESMPIGAGADRTRLVRASNQAQAIGFCVRSTYSASVATHDQLVALRHVDVESPSTTIPDTGGGGGRVANQLGSDAE